MAAPTSTLPACILAAGASERMGSPKALLPTAPGGPSFLELIAGRFGVAGCSPVVVVTREDLLPAVRVLNLPDVTVVVNPAPARGQLSSLQTALASLPGLPIAVFMTLVDVPFVRSETVTRLRQAWELLRPPLVRPVFRSRHGHPVIFGPEPVEALRRADPTSSTKAVVRRFAPLGIDVDVDDEGVVDDIDTPAEYEARLRGGTDRRETDGRRRG
jgi:molybdenum cofactor cytidylyltransferase